MSLPTYLAQIGVAGRYFLKLKFPSSMAFGSALSYFFKPSTLC